VPIDEEGEAASKTLEYAFDDWTIARMAQAMGKADIAATFDKRAGNWRNAFDKDTGFMRARKRDGSFRTPFDPSASGYGTDYTEGNAWQYSWYVPQDVAGLAAAHGGSDKLLARLDEVFNAKVDPSIFEHMEDITGLIGWYAHGNEPSHHVAYLYSYAGQPWRTQARLKQIMDTQYADRPDGLAGNDDVGQMSAWYVFTALGFYPVAPGSGEYILGRPFLPKTAMRLPNGKTFTIVADGLDDRHTYVGSVSLNGKPLQRTFLRHDEILAGGELRFSMQAEPNKDWPGQGAQAPYSMSRMMAMARRRQPWLAFNGAHQGGRLPELLVGANLGWHAFNGDGYRSQPWLAFGHLKVPTLVGTGRRPPRWASTGKAKREPQPHRAPPIGAVSIIRSRHAAARSRPRSPIPARSHRLRCWPGRSVP
jgi:putative alpha-1,2-mannosidase